jgi:drug/metabolite transporter (DMT)-like permease
MKLSGELKIILGASLFALIPVGVKMDPASSLCSLIFGRLLVASIVLCLLNRRCKTFFKLARSEFFHLVVWAGLMLFAMLFYFYAITEIGVAVSSALLGIQPLVLVLMSAFFIGEKISFQAWAACIFTLLGIVSILDLNFFTQGSFGLGQFSALLSAVLLGFVFVYQKKYLRGIGTQKAVFYQSAFQLPILLPLTFIYPPIFSVDYVSSIIVLGILCTVVSYGLIYSGVKNVAVQKIGILQSVEYVIPVFIGLFFYNEILSWKAIVGTVFILVACICVKVRVKKIMLNS